MPAHPDGSSRTYAPHEVHVHESPTDGASARTAEPPIQRSPVIQRATHLYPQIVDDFEYGDRIYGLSFTRTATIEALAQRHAPGGQDLPFARIADELNNVFIGTEMGARGGLDAYDSRSPNYQPSPEVEHQAGGFRQFLEDHPRYSPTQRDYHGMPLSTKERSWARINAACKAGLEYAVQSGHRIYFIIDEIDMVGVVKKRRYAEDTQTDIQPENRFAKFDGIGDAGNRDITPAELRWVYRQSQLSDDVRERSARPSTSCAAPGRIRSIAGTSRRLAGAAARSDECDARAATCTSTSHRSCKRCAGPWTTSTVASAAPSTARRPAWPRASRRSARRCTGC